MQLTVTETTYSETKNKGRVRTSIHGDFEKKQKQKQNTSQGHDYYVL